MTRAEAKQIDQNFICSSLTYFIIIWFLTLRSFMGRRHFTYLCNYRVFLIFILQKKATYYFNMVNCTIKFHAIVHIIRFFVMLIVPVEELGLSTAIMPLENWGLQITDRFYSFYSEAISNSLIMLPETLGLFYSDYMPVKDIFRRAKELDPKLKKWQIIMFVLTLPMWFIMVLLFMNNQPYTPFSLMGITMISGKTLFIFYIFTLMRLLQKKMAKDITSVPVRWSNGINKLYLAYNCYVACIRNIVQK